MTIYSVILGIFYRNLFRADDENVLLSFEQTKSEYVQVYYFVYANLLLFLFQIVYELFFMIYTSKHLLRISSKIFAVIF